MSTPWDRPEVTFLIDREGDAWTRVTGGWRRGRGIPVTAAYIEAEYGPCVPLAHCPTITQAEHAESLAAVADAAYAEGVRVGNADP